MYRGSGFTIEPTSIAQPSYCWTSPQGLGLGFGPVPGLNHGDQAGTSIFFQPCSMVNQQPLVATSVIQYCDQQDGRTVVADVAKEAQTLSPLIPSAARNNKLPPFSTLFDLISDTFDSSSEDHVSKAVPVETCALADLHRGQSNLTSDRLVYAQKSTPTRNRSNKRSFQPEPDDHSSGTTSNGTSDRSEISIARRSRRQSYEERLCDPSYRERRRKNNESAKRSRELKKKKEEQLLIRVHSLEQENLQLRTEATVLREEIDKLRSLLYSV